VTSADHDTDAAVSGTGPRPPRRIGLLAVVALVVLVLDLLSKVAVVAWLSSDPQHAVRLLWGGVYLVQTRNAGAAFSVGTGATVILTLIAVVIVVVIVRSARRMRSVGWAIALGLVLGGALGNLVDRLFRAPGIGRGHVVDWISLFSNDGHVWPIFNIADSAIVCGAVLSALLALRGIDMDGGRARPDRG
jgi:signal peptidase II